MHAIRLAAMLLCLCICEAVAQQPHTHLGTLTCTTGGDQAALQMPCAFKPAKGSVEERYVASLPNGALPGGKRVMVWNVIAPADAKMRRGALSQRYRISTAASVLIGESRAIALQSDSTDGFGGISQLELTLTATPA